MIEIIENYNKALQAIYDHVGFVEDWVVYPIDDKTDCYWRIINEVEVQYAETIDKLNVGEDYFQDDIYTQRFYKKWIYEGKDFTMIFCDPHVDGMKWLRLFDNKKRVR